MIEYGRVEERVDRVIVMANGPSLLEADPYLLAHSSAPIIAVNGAVRAPFPIHAFFTLDPDRIVRPLMRDKPGGVRNWYAAVPSDYGSPAARMLDHREPPEAGMIWLRRISGGAYPGGWVPGLSEDPECIHTGNSAWGALQLAVHMGAKRILLLGVDGTHSGYAFGPGAPRDLLLMRWIFGTAVMQLHKMGILVKTGNPRSRVDAFERVEANEGLKWISR